ncbi:hypothetical protein [Nocardia sp. NPDC058480]|uniref:hypothetical protein n=1 Tax=unclassified Nocardia TaxID=2637762 RepID=UPI00365D91CB
MMLYSLALALTGTAASSAALYYEATHVRSWETTPLTTPTGVAVFAEDIAIRRYADADTDIVHWSEFDRVATSGRWKYRTCSSPMCVRSSVDCAESAVSRQSRRRRPRVGAAEFAQPSAAGPRRVQF